MSADRARWYDARQGRFISEDPLGFEGGVNFYTYAESNPASLVDPAGLKPTLGRCLLRCAASQFGITTVAGLAGVGAGLPL
ncbi:MAG: RHS repeat-associated core domain-containing protein [Pyrinomonadaceae bacterium]